MATALAGQAERVALDRALTLLDGGASPATIAAALNHDGLKRFDGRRWHATSVLRLLQQVSTERPAPRLGRSPSTRPAVPGEALTIRLHQTEVVLNAVRAMLRVESVEHAVAVLQDTVRLLGGGTVPARSAGSDAIPVDISLGQGDPLLPVAPLQSPTRRVLERLVPGLVEDARRAVDLARQNRRLVSEADTDPLTGLGNRRRLDRVPSLRAED
ncbi:MAG TPA: hypothetical protein VFK41_00740, partial [Nocardioidaceae bacterium]|nr:hypothetical protein [Nocardioidaceae bacterium]